MSICQQTDLMSRFGGFISALIIFRMFSVVLHKNYRGRFLSCGDLLAGSYRYLMSKILALEIFLLNVTPTLHKSLIEIACYYEFGKFYNKNLQTNSFTFYCWVNRVCIMPSCIFQN